MQPTPKVIRGILDSAHSTFVSITFTKANGEIRQLTTNPKHIGEILGTGNPTKDPAVFRIMDVKLNQWRSFRAERVQSIKANGSIIEFSS
jgi:hypothetical protein